MDARILTRSWLLLPLCLLTGCPVTQPQNTPVAPMERLEPRTQTFYRLYVPSTYTSQRAWPLVITLHGTYGFDGLADQVNEWKALAERGGFLVAAPPLRSVQGILPRIQGLWYEDLLADERMILGLLEDVGRWYRVDPHAVVLTGFSAGGFPMYWTGLRSPRRFSMLIARAANCDADMLRSIPITDATRKMPVAIYCAVDDLGLLKAEALDARDWLRSRGVTVLAEDTRGGHTRSPEVAWRIWRNYQAAARRDPAGAADPANAFGGAQRLDRLLVP
jgi:poly(3-hydroxybutyrate) depolymerase